MKSASKKNIQSTADAQTLTLDQKKADAQPSTLEVQAVTSRYQVTWVGSCYHQILAKSGDGP